MKSVENLKESYKNLKKENYTFSDYLNDECYDLILESELFDEKWYANSYNDVKKNNLDLLDHYINLGVDEGCKPNAYFDSEWYLKRYMDVKTANINPFLHYILYGKDEGRFYSLSDSLFNSSKFRSSIQVTNILQALNKKISIIIPIYNAFEDTKACIESVFKNTKGNYELILINDNSPDSRIKPLLDKFSEKDNVKVIHNKVNQGFVKNVNIGINESKYDVILLNSDTIVTKKWLQKLICLAYSKENIGTVTPVSNNAGAFSVPEVGKENIIPQGLDINTVGNIIEKSSKRVYMSAPTGNGFCMLIKRDTINSVGLFDEINFGKGYCEENDFCMRAIEKGWINLIDDTTYIFHKKGVSFSEKREKLIKEHRKILDNKHPTYTKDVREFLKSKEIFDIQNNAKIGLEEYKSDKLDKKRILYVIHQATGGTPKTNRDLMSYVENTHDCFLLVSNAHTISLYHFKNNEFHTIEKWNLKSSWLAEKFYIEEFRDIYYNVLTKYSMDLVHIRHLMYHTFDIFEVADKLEIPIVLSFHDFYFICLSYNLLDGENVYCNGECTNTTNNCHIPMKNITNVLDMKYFVKEWRENINNILDCANYFVTTSNIVREIFAKTYPLMDLENFSVIEHGRNFEKIKNDIFEIPTLNKPIKILFIGNINTQKGSEIIKELYELDNKSHLEIHFLGNTINELKSIGIHHGQYDRDDIVREIEKIKPSFIGIFSIWSETYCHTLSEAWACGIPVLTTKIGVLEDRLSKSDAGWFIDHNSMEKTYDLILNIAKDEEEYLLKQKNAANISFKSIEEMSEEYLNIYKKLL